MECSGRIGLWDFVGMRSIGIGDWRVGIRWRKKGGDFFLPCFRIVNAAERGSSPLEWSTRQAGGSSLADEAYAACWPLTVCWRGVASSSIYVTLTLLWHVKSCKVQYIKLIMMNMYKLYTRYFVLLLFYLITKFIDNYNIIDYFLKIENNSAV